MNITPEYYTLAQVAVITQISKNKLYDLIADGTLIAQRVGRMYRIRRADMEKMFTPTRV